VAGPCGSFFPGPPKHASLCSHTHLKAHNLHLLALSKP
jgi:hypothetical protein